MTNFVRDNTSIPTKTDWDNDPAKTILTNPEMYDAGADYNTLRGACIDLRGWVQTGLTVGSYPNATLTVDADGRITGVVAGSAGVPTSRQIIATSPIRANGGASATLAADVTISLANTAVTPGAYTYGSFTVDAQGRLTAASSGATPALAATTVTGTAPITVNGGTSHDLSSNLTIAVNTFGAAQAGVVPLSGGGTNNFLRADGTWTAPPAPALFAGPGEFGTGEDGAAVFDGSTAVTGCTRSGSAYTATQSLSFTSATFSNGVTLDMTNAGAHAGFEFFAQTASVVSGTATIKWNGLSASSFTGGGLLAASPLGCTAPAGPTGIQNAGQAGTNATAWATRFHGGAGGNGGASATNAGATGGTTANTIYSEATGAMLTWSQYRKMKLDLNTPGIIHGGASGASGGGTTGVAKGGGGGGGGGCGVCGIGKFTGAGTLALEAKGGNGGDGEVQTGSNAGGGGGGGGGNLACAYGGNTFPGGITLSAAGGLKGNKQGTGNDGTAGSAGSTRTFCLGPST